MGTRIRTGSNNLYRITGRLLLRKHEIADRQSTSLNIRLFTPALFNKMIDFLQVSSIVDIININYPYQTIIIANKKKQDYVYDCIIIGSGTGGLIVDAYLVKH